MTAWQLLHQSHISKWPNYETNYDGNGEQGDTEKSDLFLFAVALRSGDAGETPFSALGFYILTMTKTKALKRESYR